MTAREPVDERPSLLYVLPHRNFFWPGRMGQVVHADGVIDGVQPHVRELWVVAAPEAPRYLGGEGRHVRFVTPDTGPFWYLRLTRCVARLVSEQRLDLVLIRSQPVFLLLVALAMLPRRLRGRGARSCVEINGLGFTFKRAGGGYRLVIRLSTLLYRLLLRPFDFVQPVNEDLGRRLTGGAFGIPARRVLVIHNGGPPLRALDAPRTRRDGLELFFFGFFHDYNDFPLLLEAVSLANARGAKVSVHFIGQGREEARLRSRADGATVFTHGPMTREEFITAVCGATGHPVGVLPMRHGNGSGSLSPLKAFEYLALGMPVLYSSNCLQDVLTHDVHGAAYREGDLASLVEQMRRLSDPSTYARYSANVRELYPQHTWERRMHALVDGMGARRNGAAARTRAAVVRE